MSQRKIDDFIGTDSEYIVYLERKVRHLIAHPGSLSPPPSFDGNNDFDIIEYDPVSSTQDASKSLRPAKRQRTQDKGRWEGEMDAMLRDINDEDLALKRKSVGLSSSPDILMALDLIIDGKRPPTERVANDTHLSVVCYDPSNIVVQLLDSFATRTAALEIDATFTTQIYHFRMLVFISLCCVALKRGVAMSVIENIMQKCVSDSTGKNLSRLRSGALWVNRMMSTLAADGFGHLAYEIFVLWGRPISQYGRFGARGDAALERFRTGVHICKPGPRLEVQAALPFVVPYVVKTIVGDIYRLSDIWTALEYGELPVVGYSLWLDYRQRKIPLPQSAILEPTIPRGEVSFDGCGSANGILDPMQLLLTAVEQGDQGRLNSHPLSVDRADSAPSQPLTTAELLMYGEGFDMVHDDSLWELIHEDQVEAPSGNV